MSKLSEYIIAWNNKHPYDFFWRRKYKVSFGSRQHLEMSFIDMKLDLIEDKEYEKFIRLYEERQKADKTILLIPAEEAILTKEELDREFEDLDIDDFDDVK